MQTTAIGTVANSLPENKVILLTLLISKGYILFAELFSNFVFAKASERRGRHIESVLALSFKENVAIFNSKGQRTALILFRS